MSTEKEITRKFSKKITIASLAAFFGIAGVGLLIGNPHTAQIIGELGPWVVALLAIYMGIGHLDFRTSKGIPSWFSDILGLAFTRRRAEAADDKKDVEL
jgi:predicted membrane protein